MIRESLLYILNVLNEYIPPLNSGAPDDLIVMGNIAMVDAYNDRANDDLENRIIASIVNIEEEVLFRNAPPAQKRSDNGDLSLRNAPIYLNLYILFAANNGRYENALHYISRVIGFFQRYRVFKPDSIFSKLDNNPISLSANFPMRVEKMSFELCTLSFEQLNHLWGIMGGKYVPSVLYKVRLLPIQEAPETDAGIVKGIRQDEAVLQN
jgi:hypothetical protein